MLAMESVDVILIRPDYAEILKKQFRFPISLVKKSIEINYPAIFLKKGKPLDKKLLNLSDELITKMGFSSLEKIE